MSRVVYYVLNLFAKIFYFSITNEQNASFLTMNGLFLINFKKMTNRKATFLAPFSIFGYICDKEFIIIHY